MAVANLAFNSGTQIWPTIVTGGATVPIAGFDGNRIPAVYAQTYIAANGGHYLLITNKSSQPQTANIVLDGASLQSTLTMTYVSSSSPVTANTAQAPTNVQIQTTTSSNPIQLGPYSVTTVMW
jgi:alpha-L-arabinofuranosidase